MLNQYFDKIFCINLARRPDRWEEASQELKKWEIKAEKFEATDGLFIDSKNLKCGEMGILQTHLRLIAKCKSEKLNQVLILEDDVIFTDELKNLDLYMKELPQWDMLYLGGNHVHGAQLYGLTPDLINEHILKTNYTLAIHAIGVRNIIFDEILNRAPKAEQPIDCYYADLQLKYNSYCFYPSVAIQREGYSDIQSTKVNYNNWIG